MGDTTFDICFLNSSGAPGPGSVWEIPSGQNGRRPEFTTHANMRDLWGLPGRTAA